MKNVMTKAWEIAKKGAAKFGGSVKSYFAQALKMAWAIVKGNELKSRLIGLLEQSKANKDIRKTLEDNYEMALMHGQKAKADAQLAEVKTEGAVIATKIQEIRDAVGQETLVAWVKEEAAARKTAKVVA